MKTNFAHILTLEQLEDFENELKIAFKHGASAEKKRIWEGIKNITPYAELDEIRRADLLKEIYNIIYEGGET